MVLVYDVLCMMYGCMMYDRIKYDDVIVARNYDDI